MGSEMCIRDRSICVMRFHEHIKGDKAECIAAMWLWEQGYLVCKNMSQQGPVDLVAIKEHEVILIDVKSACIENVTVLK